MTMRRRKKNRSKDGGCSGVLVLIVLLIEYCFYSQWNEDVIY